MAKIKHIALTTGDPVAAAEFYKEAFELVEVRRSENGAVILSDGYINLTILNYKTAATDADVGPNGDNYDGIHHIGFQVDDIDEACQRLEGAKGRSITSKKEYDAMAPGGPQNNEMKWSGPDDVVIDISQTGWVTSA